ncbi:MAG: dimethyl sulfoxide reductase subunit A, partial [Deltaproteobacteria bacterium]|nr:dimethyl sulfoxide reductase subunit A [Deltaproteobacteria bacterium]
FDAMKQDGVRKVKLPEPIVAFKEQIRDPENNPFPTLSGKVEIDCGHIAEMENPRIPSIPQYLGHDEHYDAPLAAKYPLQLLTAHAKARTHSALEMVPWLQEIESHGVWISPVDAASRDIAQGDMVDVFNDRGRIRIPAKVTERIMPGVVNVFQGAWYSPDKDGVDTGGCANVLTGSDHSPGGALSMNSALVQVERSRSDQQEEK